ncbi:hypothetical protein EMIHUDRAFT_205525 [Emiliania huxleyi CCMP1516]|uniref:Methyltransferase type 11 domain-containing protein n=2 Tax=Emiliania huxleyi TaxID=2903 RepID=A0A0D3JSI7_EMIH1|nr:hypothetical protein EMIHUDRAFT_205525 [Emiliania huxleyi CCMP1516]EOD26472.1 hypothetical protein EMIHUDRAFT_205525 [Emiliania huxleyi CCMP1516]|eukprot:XP_005778901.1 hypothetical protein EMIHUDRAFT_205525 [Emiliania huxleyi CCMP1516]
MPGPYSSLMVLRRRASRSVGVALASSSSSVEPGPWETGLSAAEVLSSPAWPAAFPLTATHLARLDETPDTRFYARPRINVQHVDESAIAALQELYAQELPRGGAVLDLMSSWTSHLAEGRGRDRADGHFARVSGLGAHAEELRANPALHDYHAHDINADPRLPMYADESFDAVVCSVSVDYLADPLPVFREIHRVLKPGGPALFTWSNRMFPTKAIAAWREASEPARLWICGAYFHYSVPGGFTPPEGVDLSPHAGRSDPVYALRNMLLYMYTH